LNHYYLIVGTIYHLPSNDPNVNISKLCHVLKEVVEPGLPYFDN